MAQARVERWVSVDAVDLNDLDEAMREVENAANGYGRLISCIIQVGDNTRAVYDDSQWSVEVKLRDAQ